MKKITIFCAVVLLLGSCATTAKFKYDYAKSNQVSINLSNGNFNNLGSFTGMATFKYSKAMIKGKLGLIAMAKKDLLDNAKAGGAEVIGNRMLVNVSIDELKSLKRVTISITADVVEFVQKSK